MLATSPRATQADSSITLLSPSRTLKSSASSASSPAVPIGTSHHSSDDNDPHHKTASPPRRSRPKAVPSWTALREVYRSIPPRYKWALVMFWLLWKFLSTAFVLYWVGSTVVHHVPPSDGSTSSSSAAAIRSMAETDGASPPQVVKVLYMVTSLSEYNTGTRNTVKGQDRLGEVMLPVLVDSIESMLQHHNNKVLSGSTSDYVFQVDLYLILAYTLRPERRLEIRQRLPPTVGLQVWDDACPLGYDRQHDLKLIHDNTRALSRQHRYVIKDKFLYYDLFLAFEDDMRLTGHHIQQFLDVSRALDQLRQAAPGTVPEGPEVMVPVTKQRYFGDLTRRQMDRLIPGFIRVEVLLDESVNGAQRELDPIPLDHQFTTSRVERHFDPEPCCHVNMRPNRETPTRPGRDQVVIWETSIKALSLRRLPTLPKSAASLDAAGAGHKAASRDESAETVPLLDWVALLPGPGKRLEAADLMGGYWSGRRGAFGKEEKPSPGMPDLIAQQGGWMATREQIWRLNRLCQGSFLPPFDLPMYRGDGQESMNVEFWSGGYQFFTGVRGGCNMQRVVSLHPDHFSKHFIYHVANNKQKQLAQRRMVRADHLFGQLNAVRKMAEQDMQQQLDMLQAQR